jgi:hypothetical protein
VGKEVTPFAALLGHVEVAAGNIQGIPGGATSWNFTTTDLTLGPGLRLHTRGERIRFVSDVAGGLALTWAHAEPTALASMTGQASGGGAAGGKPSPISGMGLGPALDLTVGLEVRWGVLYASGGLEMMIRGVGSVRTASVGKPFFEDSATARLGPRLALGYTF